jgi:hypothetical protein
VEVPEAAPLGFSSREFEEVFGHVHAEDEPA